MNLYYEYEYDNQTMIHFAIQNDEVTEIRIEILFCESALDVTEAVESQLPWRFRALKNATQLYWDSLEKGKTEPEDYSDNFGGDNDAA